MSDRLEEEVEFPPGLIPTNEDKAFGSGFIINDECPGKVV